MFVASYLPLPPKGRTIPQRRREMNQTIANAIYSVKIEEGDKEEAGTLRDFVSFSATRLRSPRLLRASFIGV